MRALVTGAGGFLGFAIAKLLRARGDQVRSFSRQTHDQLETLGVKHIRGDLADAAAVSSALRGCDVVFHVAAKAGAWGPYPEYYSANVLGTRHVIDACRQHGTRHLVYTSSPSVVFDGRDLEGADESLPYPPRYEAHYPQTKAIAEREALAANDERLRTVALRPHLIWGPGDTQLTPRLIARAKAGRLRRISGPIKQIDATYIDDAARAHLLAADRLAAADGAAIGGKVYFISSGQPVAIWEFVDRILAAAGLPAVTRAVSPRTALRAGCLLEGLHRLLRIQREPAMTRWVARELSTAHWFDLGAARRDLGYEPSVTIEQGLQQLAGWLRRTAASG